MEDELLKNKVADVFAKKLREVGGAGPSAFSIDDTIRVCFRTIELTFGEQGIEVSHFLESAGDTSHIHKTVADHLDEALEQCQITPEVRQATGEAAFYVLRKAFYQSDEAERLYLSKLSRTYCLLFTLKNHPEVVEYFKGMSSKLVLYIGSDLLVRALSERYLDPEDAMTRNVFKILRDAGSTLILTERTLTEVHTHLIACDQEYKNHYLRLDRLMSFQLARQIDEILIRTYFYGSLERRATDPANAPNWADFISSFLSYQDLYVDRGREALRLYLCEKFRLDFEEESQAANVDPEALEDLTDALAKTRAGKGANARVLAENDAWQVLRVYDKRAELKETHRPNRYGYRTWWLTQETAVLKVTGKLVARKGTSYIMRPEFLLNFIALSPKAEEVRRSYDTIFPSLLGIQLSNRLKPGVFNDWIAKIGEVESLDDARAKAMASQYSDQLKADQFKRYAVNLGKAEEMHRTLPRGGS